MLFERVVSCSGEVSSTSSRTAKIAAAVLRQFGPLEVASAVGFLSGVARQGRIGLGWGVRCGVQSCEGVDPHAYDRRYRLLDAMRDGLTYTNVHTNDGVDPANTGAGDMASGEIRGQNQPRG